MVSIHFGGLSASRSWRMRRALGILLLFALQAHSFVQVKPLLSNARCLAVAGRRGTASLKMQIKNPVCTGSPDESLITLQTRNGVERTSTDVLTYLADDIVLAAHHTHPESMCLPYLPSLPAFLPC